MSNHHDRMRLGLFVMHKYGRHRHGRIDTCERCGTKRRKTTSGWQWKSPGRAWTATNPVCTSKP